MALWAKLVLKATEINLEKKHTYTSFNYICTFGDDLPQFMNSKKINLMKMNHVITHFG